MEFNMNARTAIVGSCIQKQAAISQVGLNHDHENLAEVGLFDEMWPARHNQELWGTAPSGIYDSVPPRS